MKSVHGPLDERIKEWREELDDRTLTLRQKQIIFNKIFGALTFKQRMDLLNYGLKEITKRGRLEETVKNLKDKPLDKTLFKKTGLDDFYWSNPQAYFEEKRQEIKNGKIENGLSDRGKIKFDKLLVKAVVDTYPHDTTERRQEIVTQKWREILFCYIMVEKRFSKRDRTPGRPRKTQVNIFTKYLNLIFKTLDIPRRQVSSNTATHLEIIQSFLYGYLKIGKSRKEIHEYLYR